MHGADRSGSCRQSSRHFCRHSDRLAVIKSAAPTLQQMLTNSQKMVALLRPLQDWDQRAAGLHDLTWNMKPETKRLAAWWPLSQGADSRKVEMRIKNEYAVNDTITVEIYDDTDRYRCCFQEYTFMQMPFCDSQTVTRFIMALVGPETKSPHGPISPIHSTY